MNKNKEKVNGREVSKVIELLR